MNVENKVSPSREQREVLAQPGPDGPIVMVNLPRSASARST